MTKEQLPQCTYETPDAFCGISQKGEACNLFEQCVEAHKNGDLTPANFCRGSEIQIDTAIGLREAYLKLDSNCQYPMAIANAILSPSEKTEENIRGLIDHFNNIAQGKQAK